MTYSLDAAPNTPWPPPETARTMRDIRECAAYWTNDERDLFTANEDEAKTRGTWLRRRQTDTPTASRPRNVVTMPIAGDIAATSADLLFGDAVPLALDDAARGDQKTRAEELATRISLDLHAAADIAAGIGGVWLVPRWDVTVTDRATLQPIGQDQVWPEYRSGMLVAATIVQVLTPLDANSPDVWRHFERHETGVVHHQLRLGTSTEIGRVVPLTEHPETRYLADLPLTGGTAISLEGFQSSGAPRGILPSWVPNAFDRRSRTREYGSADFAKSNTLRMIDALNECMSAWAREIRIGQARLLIAESALDRDNRVDLDDELVTVLKNVDQVDMPDPIRQVQFDLRTAEFRETAQFLTEQIVSKSGYAPQTFGMHTEGAISGTAISLRELRTHRTTGRKQAAWAPAYARTARWMLAIDHSVYGMKGADQPDTLTVVWPETDTDDPKARAETLDILARAQAMSIETRVRLAQPDLDPDQVADEVARIKAETGGTATVLPDVDLGVTDDDDTSTE